MVVNFRVREISRSARKLIRTSMLIKKKTFESVYNSDPCDYVWVKNILAPII